MLRVSVTRSKAGLGAIGSVLSAIASSACCWLPLLLMGFGLSAGGLSAWFERYRLAFLIVASALLAFGFYSVYFAARKRDSSCGCETSTSRAQRFSKVMLWVSAIVVIAFASFPRYAGALLSRGDSSKFVAIDADLISVSIEGMTCEACSVHLEDSLSRVPGVLDARVSYTQGVAELKTDPHGSFDPQAALNAIDRAGYSGSLAVPSGALLRTP